MLVAGVAVDTPHILAALLATGHMHIVLEIRILQRVLDIATLEVRTAARGSMAAQADRPVRQGDPLGDNIKPLLVLIQDGPPLPFAVIILVQVPAVTLGVAHQAIDIAQLLPRGLLARQFAQTGVTAGTAFGQGLALIVQHPTDPLFTAGVGAEVIDHAQLAELLLLPGVDQVRGAPPPLVVLAVKEGQCLFPVAPQAGSRALVVLVVVLMPIGFFRVVREHIGASNQQPRQQQPTPKAHG